MRDITEIWRVEYKAKAYQDQTGQDQSGYVVYERLDIKDTGERYDVQDEWSDTIYKNIGRIYASDDSRRFHIVWGSVLEGGKAFGGNGYGYWRIPPPNARGYVYADTNNPVKLRDA